MIRVPDFFIVGAPKCGTTAMNDYLAQHPEVFVPARKEVHFFGSDLVLRRPRVSPQDYLRLFSKWRDEKRGGEASVWYLYSRLAAREIHDFNPDSRIIVMLRHPVDMMYSLHSQRIYNGTEDLESFEEALAAEPERRLGRKMPSQWDNTMGCFYRDAARFTAQLERYLHVFGRARVHVILFDDFRRDLVGTYRDVCEFLEVDSGFRPEFDVVNPNKRVRSERLRDFLRFASPTARSRIRAIVPGPGVRQALKRQLRSLNTAHVQRPMLEAELRARLEEQFRPEIEALGRLLGRDLAAEWCRSAAAAPERDESAATVS